MFDSIILQLYVLSTNWPINIKQVGFTRLWSWSGHKPSEENMTHGCAPTCFVKFVCILLNREHIYIYEGWLIG